MYLYILMWNLSGGQARVNSPVLGPEGGGVRFNPGALGPPGGNFLPTQQVVQRPGHTGHNYAHTQGLGQWCIMHH